MTISTLGSSWESGDSLKLGDNSAGISVEVGNVIISDKEPETQEVTIARNIIAVHEHLNGYDDYTRRNKRSSSVPSRNGRSNEQIVKVEREEDLVEVVVTILDELDLSTNKVKLPGGHFNEEGVNWKEVDNIVKAKQENKLYAIFKEENEMQRIVPSGGGKFTTDQGACLTPSKRRLSPTIFAPLGRPSKLIKTGQITNFKDRLVWGTSGQIDSPRIRTNSIASGLGTPNVGRNKKKLKRRCNSVCSKADMRNQQKITDLLVLKAKAFDGQQNKEH